ncbi:hypothetical protein BC835DRAFT_1418140 [Cytidiella melzeri]|nr:hypothetical protein BC835DRAFT_1418140 [Cytidiella melzeri]
MPSTLAVNRYIGKARATRTKLSRLPWRTRTRRKVTQTRTFTPAERKAAKEAVMSRKEQNNTKVSNALLEVWKLAEGLHRDIGTNTAQYCTPRRRSCVKAPAIMTEMRNKWKALSSVEKIEATQETLENLFNRTGVEILLFASRSDSSAFMHPLSWSTGDHIDEYFQMTFKKSTGQFAGMLECFLLSGLEEDCKLIFEKLEATAHPHKVSRMFYSDFYHHITEKYGIIIENWPLPVFTSPGSIGSRIELNTLFNAWESGATRFRRLTPAELIEWERQQAQARQQTTPMTQAPGSSDASSTAPVTGDGPDADPNAPASAAPSTSITPAAGPAPSTSTAPTALNPPVTALTGTSQAYGTSVFAVGNRELVTKKPRKTRSDKGKLRGPSKKKQVLVRARVQLQPEAYCTHPRNSIVLVRVAFLALVRVAVPALALVLVAFTVLVVVIAHALGLVAIPSPSPSPSSSFPSPSFLPSASSPSLPSLF